MRLLEAIGAIPGDRVGQRGVENRHLAPKRRKIRHGLAAWTIRRYQLCDGPPSLRDDDLAPLSHLVEENREVLAGLTDSGGAHDAIVLHVAHDVKPAGPAPVGARRPPTAHRSRR